MTVIAALELDGVRAPLACPGAVDAATFQAYVDQILVPALRAGDVVVFEDLASHLGPAVFEAIERAGAIVLPLPPYSPDFTPIEEMLSKFKEFPAGSGRGPRITRMTPSEKDYERSRPKIFSVGFAMLDRVQLDREPL